MHMGHDSEPSTFEDLLGKTLLSVESADHTSKLVFVTDDGWKLEQLHHQDCCESVYIESIDGDLNDLVGTPIMMAEEISQLDNDDENGNWTFYKLATIKGYVTIRWYGTSNGYYSTAVSSYWEKV